MTAKQLATIIQRNLKENAKMNFLLLCDGKPIWLDLVNVCMSADCDDPTLQNEGAMVFTQQKETIDGEN